MERSTPQTMEIDSRIGSMKSSQDPTTASAMAVLWARLGVLRNRIRRDIEAQFGYDLSISVDELRETYQYIRTCQRTGRRAGIDLFYGSVCGGWSPNQEKTLINGFLIHLEQHQIAGLYTLTAWCVASSICISGKQGRTCSQPNCIVNGRPRAHLIFNCTSRFGQLLIKQILKR